MLNIIVHKLRNLKQHSEQQFDLTCESITIRTGPYDNSDCIEIKYLPDTREYVVLHHHPVMYSPECVLSVPEEPV